MLRTREFQIFPHYTGVSSKGSLRLETEQKNFSKFLCLQLVDQSIIFGPNVKFKIVLFWIFTTVEDRTRYFRFTDTELLFFHIFGVIYTRRGSTGLL